MSIIRTISSRQAERGRMSGGGSLWHTEQRALTSSSVAIGCDDAPVGPDPDGGVGDCWIEGLPVLRAWSTPPNRMAAARSQPDGRRKGFTIRVYASGRFRPLRRRGGGCGSRDGLARLRLFEPAELGAFALRVGVASGAGVGAREQEVRLGTAGRQLRAALEGFDRLGHVARFEPHLAHREVDGEMVRIEADG